MENKKVKKINLIYLLSYIFAPILICVLCYVISMNHFPKGNMAVILIMVPSFLAFIWWVFAGKIIYGKAKKKLEKQLEDNGFIRNNTFYGDGFTVVVDTENGKIALVSFWNPFENYILPASRITKTWVDDGKSGFGIFEGSGRVSFLFSIDNTKVRVNTFTSNTRWRMDSEQILTGISKADKMVEVLEEARKKVN